MRIRIDVAGIAREDGDTAHSSGLLRSLLQGDFTGGNWLAVLIVRIDNQTAFASPARFSNEFVGSLHTDWMTLTTEQSENFMELRGKTVEVLISGTCASSEAGSPIHVQLNMSGAHPFLMTQQVLARGDLQGRLEAHAGSFVRIDLSRRAEGQSHGGVLGRLMDSLSRISF